nr:MAG TPA: minor tail protein [Caudoviricetes sp.]
MAKNKVINTVLTLKDEMSGGLVAAAKAAKKSGKNIDDSMMQATRKVVAFKNKSLTALGDFAKKGVKAAGAAVAGMTAAFIALDGATEEYRIAQGKLNAGFQAAGFSADVARKSYRNFYAILGDTDTATEASQLLANMAKTEKDVATWTRIAAGVHGTFGDSLPIEGLVESANETARTGQVTGVFADALNWVGILEDDFNAKLEKTTDVSKRNQLIMDTLSKTYDKAADSFYANNQQVVNARRNHATLDEMLAKVGDTSSKLKNQLWVLAGATEDGSIRSGSMLDWVQRKAEAFGQWIEGLDLSSLQKQFDEQFARALQKAGEALQWVRDNSDTLIGTLKKLAVAWGVGKMLAFTAGAIETVQTIGGFIKTLKRLIVLKGKDTAAWAANTACVIANKVALAAHAVVGGMRWLVNGIATLMTSAVEWSVNTACIIANKAALIAHKAVGGVVWLVQQAAALGVASAAWIHNTAMMVVNKAGMVASAVASGVATGATAALTAAQWALNAAFVATPIGWIVLGLAAVVAAGVALYKNWDTVKAKAGEVWNSIKTAFGGIRDSITGAFSAAKEKVAGFFSWLNQKIESVPILGSIYKGGKSAVSWVADHLDGNAMGTPYWRGGLTRVNERGGEIMRLPSGTQIIPHDVSVKAAGGRSVTVNVNIQGNVIGNREYTEQVGEYVGRKVLAALGNI